MYTVMMYGRTSLTIFWIWAGCVAAITAAYWIYYHFHPRSKEKTNAQLRAMKYAQQLQQRLRKKPSLQTSSEPLNPTVSHKQSHNKGRHKS